MFWKRIYNFNKVPGITEAADLGTALWGPWKKGHLSRLFRSKYLKSPNYAITWYCYTWYPKVDWSTWSNVLAEIRLCKAPMRQQSLMLMFPGPATVLCTWPCDFSISIYKAPLYWWENRITGEKSWPLPRWHSQGLNRSCVTFSYLMLSRGWHVLCKLEPQF